MGANCGCFSGVMLPASDMIPSTVSEDGSSWVQLLTPMREEPLKEEDSPLSDEFGSPASMVSGYWSIHSA